MIRESVTLMAIYNQQRDIDRPLGRDRRPPRRLRVLPSARVLWSAAALLAIVAGGAYTAFDREDLRNPQPTQQETVDVAALDDEAANTPDEPAVTIMEPTQTEASPSIITVPPEPDTARPDPGETTGSVIVIRDPSAVTQNPRTAHLPDRALLEQSEHGPLPVTGPDGRRPFDVYARPWSGARGARVAIVIGGLGLSQTGTQAAIRKLPGEVTLAFAPHGNSIGRWMQEARRGGHELVIQVPFEPFDYPNINPGRNTLTVDADAAQNLGRLHWALARTTNYTGVVNYMGARYLADAQALAPVMEDLGRRGLMFLDDGTLARSMASDLALRSRVPFAAGDAVIDAKQERGAILKKLDQLEATARARGFAIGTGSAFEVTVDAVASWVTEARKRGIEIVPVSALAADPR